jgi:hypothetical protein
MPAIEHSVCCAPISGRQTDTYGAVGSLGGTMRTLSTASHSIVMSSQDVVTVPVSPVHCCEALSVIENRSASGGSSQPASNMTSDGRSARVISCS